MRPDFVPGFPFLSVEAWQVLSRELLSSISHLPSLISSPITILIFHIDETKLTFISSMKLISS